MKKLRILLIEDKSWLAARLKLQLDSLGHDVVGVIDDGRRAADGALRLAPDLIMIESRLPFVDGIETARSILARKPIPIVLLTAYAAAEFVRRAREVGVVAHLVTPVEPWQLTSIIEAALARFRQLAGRRAS